MPAETTVHLNERESQYELSLEGEQVGKLVYRDVDGTRVLLHTEVDPKYRGRGLATELIAWALDDVRDSGMRLRVECPTVTDYLKSHPEADFR